MTKEIDVFFPEHFTYMRCTMADVPEENLLVHLDEAVAFIAEARENSSSILVHCQMGVSRSASAVIAYIMKTYGWDLDRAHAYVKSKRNVVKPNKGFWQQLREFEQRLQLEWKASAKQFMAAPADSVSV
mmetsp:Transcript_12818/g.39415  ORF Transcript_12818/g.39415 Transcript_12818/m.39415 type:complete len:129 (+) Transcript_12818:2046-2432(+)